MDLQIGEEVLTVDSSSGELTFSPVIAFLDRDPKEPRQFFTIRTESGHTLTLTPTHLVYAVIPPQQKSAETLAELQVNEVETSADFVAFEAMYAKDVQEGDLVLVQNGQGQLKPTRVSAVETKVLTGVYAPLTSAGNLVVDNVVASCYAVVDSQWVAHTAFAPLRLMASIWPSSPASITEGIHWYAKGLYSLAEYVMPNHLAP